MNILLDPHEVVKKAWDELPIQKEPCVVEGFANSKFHVKRLRQSVLLTERNQAGAFADFKIVAYPNPAHIKEFEKAAKSVAPDGPAMYHLGAIGTAKGSIASLGNTTNVYLEYVQSHYTTQEPYGLKRSLSTKYGGWANSVLIELARQAKTLNATVIIRPQVIKGSFKEKCKKTLNDLRIKYSEDRVGNLIFKP